MNSIQKIDNLYILFKNNKRICIKKTNFNSLELYKYLSSKGFNNYIKTEINNGYEKRDYIEEINITNEDKINELIYIISLLHTKTTHFKTYNLNDIKIFYEKITDEILEIKNYYNEILENNDIYTFLKPSIYLLINKISLILISLDNCKFFLDKWYDIVKEKQSKRVVLNHNNLKLSNLIVGEIPYLINFDKSIFDYPIYDLVSLFKNNYKTIDMFDLYNLYNIKYCLSPDEKYLLYVMLLKIDKISFNKKEIINTREISDLIEYLEKISFFLKNSMKAKE